MKQTGGSGGLRCAMTALLGLLGLGTVVLIGGATWALTHLPDPSDALPAALNPARVTITQPVSGQSLPLEQTLTVYAKAFGEQPIQDVQLYVDGKLLGGQSADFPAGAVKATASWAWTPKDAGEHVLTARARTVDGKGNVSNAVIIKALAADQFPSFTSLAGIGTVTAPSEEELNALSDGGTPMEPPAVGGQAPPAEPADEAPIPPPAEEPKSPWLPISISWWIQQKLGNIIPLSIPEAPQINGLAKDCDGLLVVKDNADNEAGFFLYRLDPGKFVFERVATLDGKQGKPVFSYVDKGLASGTYYYYVSAFNPKGEAPSNVVSVKVEGPVCDAALPPIFEPDSIPVDPAQPVDKMYCYGSADDMPWVRLPSGQGVFLAPVNGKFDLAPYWKLIPLPKPLPPKFLLNMECWGWSGEALVYLGVSSKEYITAKENKKQKPGEPEPTKPADGIGNGIKIAPPYNLRLTSNFADCEKHIESGNHSEIHQCEEILGTNNTSEDDSYRTMLVWDWDLYYGCDPGTEKCDMDYSKVGYFMIFEVFPGSEPLMVGTVLDPTNTFFHPSHSPIPNDEFFVWACNGASTLCSADSNHVKTGDLQTLVLLPSPGDGKMIKKRIVLNKMGNGTIQTPAKTDAWFYQTFEDGEFISGYSRVQDMSDLRTTYYYSRVRYNLPEDKNIISASLMWNWTDGKAMGPGGPDLSSACHVYVTTKEIDHTAVIAGSIWQDGKPHDVSGALDEAEMMGWGQVEFWFTHQTTFSSTVYPNICYMRFGTPLLTLKVLDSK